MLSNKTLKISPNLFTLSKKMTRNNKKREKPILKKDDIINTNKVKKKLLSQVKDYQKKIEQEKKQDTLNVYNDKSNNNESNFEAEFNKSLLFLQGLAEKNKKKKTVKDNNRLHNNINELNNNNNNINVSLELPDELKKTQIYTNVPLYGCLKNGNTQTYKNYMRTLKNKDDYNFPVKKNVKINIDNISNNNIDNISNNNINNIINNIDNISNNIDNISNNNENRFDNANDIINKIDNIDNIDNIGNIDNIDNIGNIDNIDNIGKNISHNTYNTKIDLGNNIDDIVDTKNKNTILINKKVDNIPRKLRITRTIKHKVGRDKEKNTVGILLKDRKTIKNINKETTKLKNKSIEEIKEYLRDKNIIKSGSLAPNDVLRKLYEVSILSGNVNNINSTNLLHNYNIS